MAAQMIERYEIDPAELALDDAELCRALGYPQPEAVSPAVRRRLPELIEDARRIVRPVALARVAPIRCIADRLDARGGPTFRGAMLTYGLMSVTEAAFFVLTLGDAASAEISAVSARDISDGVTLDVIVSELVEAAADRLEPLIAGRRAHTVRYSPGYCDWAIEELSNLLAFVDAERIGVTQTSRGMMVPRKTVAGLIGLSDDPTATTRLPCEVCNRDCANRRRRITRL
jgi:hypothetical protein